ncbi:single-stranded DNA-binding protein [Bifidobacterium callitrichos]|uniref:SsDNA-binding protein n=1 Tax=Bifidobacterium callitrichos DSM 23973 TaxID=1437609 RepID=A0A087ABF2_9BIFI|nr:single-stranded DNA-binding protein [Bifidobacterium callitrichos]KFI56102.1 ssDNA-binding protein [Bifidobacterium callitrichos DSM 23973]
MGIQQIQVTVTGNLGADPRSFSKNIDAPACSFRIGVTPRFYDSGLGQWRDRETTWVGVRAYRTLASNILGSLHKGDPVIVTGTLHSERWRKEGEQTDRFTPVIDAVAVGHDLSQGVGRFRRVGREQPASDASDSERNDRNGQNVPSGQGADSYANAGADGAGAPSNDPLPGASTPIRPVDILGASQDDDAAGTEVYGAMSEDESVDGAAEYDDTTVDDDGVIHDESTDSTVASAAAVADSSAADEGDAGDRTVADTAENGSDPF